MGNKVIASSVSSLEAGVAGTAKDYSKDSAPKNTDFVNSKAWQGIEELFVQLRPRRARSCN